MSLPPSVRAVAVALVNAAACIILTHGVAAAQTCSISSTAPGPLSCAVTTTVHMSLRIPAMVGVTLTSPAALPQTSPVVHAGLTVKTNRSYSLQIAQAPVDASGDLVATSTASSGVTWATASDRASLDETPTQIDTYDGPSDDRDPIQVAFARDSRRRTSALDPIRLVLTIVAP